MKPAAALLPALFLLTGCGGAKPVADASPTPTVLVTLVPLDRGSELEWVTAYGSIAPASNGVQTISVPQPGQVTRLLTTLGSAVRAGQPLAVFTTAPSVVASYRQAEAALTAAQKQRGTTAQLLSQQLATRDQLTLADKAVTDAKSTLNGLTLEGAGLPVRSLVAPFAGVVTAMPVAQGDRLASSAPIMTVARSGQLLATAGLDAGDAARVRVGQPARIFRIAGGGPLAGRVTRVDALLNPKTRQVDVDMAFPLGTLVTNEAVRTEIAVGQVSGWLAPHQAVVTANGAPRIFQAVAGKAKAVPVRVLLAGEKVDVVEGSPDLSAKLIVDGAYQVNDGDAVRVAGAR